VSAIIHTDQTVISTTNNNKRDAEIIMTGLTAGRWTQDGIARREQPMEIAHATSAPTNSQIRKMADSMTGGLNAPRRICGSQSLSATSVTRPATKVTAKPILVGGASFDGPDLLIDPFLEVKWVWIAAGAGS
jgi:hypothetical protein